MERPGRHRCCLATGHRRVLAVYHDLENGVGSNETALRERATSASMRHRVSTNSWHPWTHSYLGIAALLVGTRTRVGPGSEDACAVATVVLGVGRNLLSHAGNLASPSPLARHDQRQRGQTWWQVAMK